MDLYLVHGPNLIEKDVEGSWKEFEKIKEDGLAKYVLLIALTHLFLGEERADLY